VGRGERPPLTAGREAAVTSDRGPPLEGDGCTNGILSGAMLPSGDEGIADKAILGRLHQA